MGHTHICGGADAKESTLTMRGERLTVLMVLVSACGGASGPASPDPRENVVRNDRSADIGRATIRQQGDRILIHVLVTGLKPGIHGMHLHAVGLCQGPAFTTAGSHLNPGRMKHGNKNPQGPHLGDLANLSVNKDGRAEKTVTVKGPEAAKGLKSFLGTSGVSLVIHAEPDDERTDPTGNSGARLACVAFRP